VVDVSLEDLQLYEGPLVRNIESLGDQVLESMKKNMLVSFFTGGPENTDEVKALDQALSELHQGGIRGWVMNTDENLSMLAPDIGSPEVADRLVESVEQSFSVPDFIPSERPLPFGNLQVPR
jgi:hypothetical protein